MSVSWVFTRSTCWGWVTSSDPCHPKKYMILLSLPLLVSGTHHPGRFPYWLLCSLSFTNFPSSFSKKWESQRNENSLPSSRFLSRSCQLIPLLNKAPHLYPPCPFLSNGSFLVCVVFSWNCRTGSFDVQLFKHLNLVKGRVFGIIFVSGFSHP